MSRPDLRTQVDRAFESATKVVAEIQAIYRQTATSVHFVPMFTGRDGSADTGKQLEIDIEAAAKALDVRRTEDANSIVLAVQRLEKLSDDMQRQFHPMEDVMLLACSTLQDFKLRFNGRWGWNVLAEIAAAMGSWAKRYQFALRLGAGNSTLLCRTNSELNSSRPVGVEFEAAIGKRLDLERALVREYLETASKPLGVASVNNEGDANEADDLSQLKKPERLAYLAAQHAEAKEGRELTYRQAWHFLRQNGVAGSDESCDYVLPKMKTFEDYLSNAMCKLGKSRKTPRGGRTGRSVRKQSEL